MIGDMIKKLRLRSKQTQKDVANKLGIPRSTYSNYETGLREPDIEKIKKLAEIFNVSMDDLTETSQDLLDRDIDVYSTEDLLEKYNFKIDGKQLTDEEARGFLAFVRANRSLGK